MGKQQTDADKIKQLLEDFYFKGIYEGNLDKLIDIYHRDTLLFGDVKGQPYAKTLVEYLDGVANRKSPQQLDQPFKGKILNIQVINSIAVAEVKVKMYDFNYHEFLSFHKINNHWLIVNKMMSDVQK